MCKYSTLYCLEGQWYSISSLVANLTKGDSFPESVLETSFSSSSSPKRWRNQYDSISSNKEKWNRAPCSLRLRGKNWVIIQNRETTNPNFFFNSETHFTWKSPVHVCFHCKSRILYYQEKIVDLFITWQKQFERFSFISILVRNHSQNWSIKFSMRVICIHEEALFLLMKVETSFNEKLKQLYKC